MLESVDAIPRDPDTTDFKRRARLHQALWRETMGFPIGSQPMVPKPGDVVRPLGSRLELGFARTTGANFLDDSIRLVSERAGIFQDDAVERIAGTDLQQIWLDHLLALSLVQEPAADWSWSAFVLVHPAGNPSYARSTERYRLTLSESSSFRVSTLEDLLGPGVLEPAHEAAFRQRYLWG